MTSLYKELFNVVIINRDMSIDNILFVVTTYR